MPEHKTVFDNNFRVDEADTIFNYQKELTPILDLKNSDFDQQIINEILLWKLNRYAKISSQALDLINEIDISTDEINEDLTREVLKQLLLTKGIQLPMASTILRFRNKKIYQIIDQRVFRIIYPGKKLKINPTLNVKNISIQVDLYIQYLNDLKKVCHQFRIEFENVDRILYMADKRINSNIPLGNYANRTGISVKEIELF